MQNATIYSYYGEMEKRLIMKKQFLVVAISSQALFNLDESNKIYEQQGKEAYCYYQIDNENVPLQ